MAKDALASGAASAVFVGGKPKIDDPIHFNWRVNKDEEEKPESVKALNKLRSISDYAHYQPMNDRVLLRRVEQKDEGLIQLPDAFKEDSLIGEVISVGSGMYVGDKLLPIDLVPGDLVRFGAYSWEPIKFENEELVLISAFDVRLKIRNATN